MSTRHDHHQRLFSSKEINVFTTASVATKYSSFVPRILHVNSIKELFREREMMMMMMMMKVKEQWKSNNFLSSFVEQNENMSKFHYTNLII